MTSLKYLFIAIIAAFGMLAACSDPKEFTVEAKVEGADADSHTIELSWYDGHAMRQTDARPLDGSVKLRGQTPGRTVVWVTDRTTGRLLGMAIAENGDFISLNLDIANTIATVEARANKPTEQLTAFLRDNAPAILNGNTIAINAAASEFITANPASPASTAILCNIFATSGYETEADSLLRLISPEARTRQLLNTFPTMLASQLSVDATGSIGPRTIPGPGGKSIRFFPRDASLSIIVFADDQGGRLSDSTRRLITELTERFPRRRLRALEVSSAADSASWAHRIERDSTASWDRTWTPLATADRTWRATAIPRLPFYIVVDSTGAQLLRTSSAATAKKFVNQSLTGRTNP